MMLFVDKHAVHAPAVFGTAVEEQRRTRGLQGVVPGTDSRTLWDRLDGETRRMVLDKLLREQGHLCVYCERTIGTGRSRLDAQQYPISLSESNCLDAVLNSRRRDSPPERNRRSPPTPETVATSHHLK